MYEFIIEKSFNMNGIYPVDITYINGEKHIMVDDTLKNLINKILLIMERGYEISHIEIYDN